MKITNSNLRRFNGGPEFRQTYWKSFELLVISNVNFDRGDRDKTWFQRHKKRHRDYQGFGLSLIYDPYIPTFPVDVTMHCVVCLSHKRATLHVTEGMKRPATIVAYKCSRCNGRTWRNAGLVKQFPRAYGSWCAMRARTTYKYANAYEHYGGRGIVVCPRWSNHIDGFSNFVSDMGERPEGASIDRIDPDGNYTLENCRWANAWQQTHNRRCSTPEQREASLNSNYDDLEYAYGEAAY